MAAPSKTITYETLQAFTKDVHDKKLVSDVQIASPLVRLMNSKKMTEDMGERININIDYRRSDGTGNKLFSLSDGLQDRDFFDDEMGTQAYVTPIWLERGILITKQQQDVNKGQAQIVSLLDRKYKFLTEQMQFGLKNATNGFWSDGTAAAGSWLGLPYYVRATGQGTNYSGAAVTGTVANIDRTDSTYQYWTYNVVDDQTTLDTWNWKKMEEMENDCTEDGSEERTPDVWITTKAIFEHIWAQAHELQRNKIRTGLAAKLGLRVITFNGKEIIWDPFCPASQMYALHTNDWEWRVFPDSNMKVMEWEQSQIKYAKQKSMIVGGQLVCTNPRRQGVFTALA